MVRFLDPETTEILPFLDPEIVKMDKKNLDPEIVEMVWFLDPEIVEKVDKSFMDFAQTMNEYIQQVTTITMEFFNATIAQVTFVTLK